MDEQYHLSLHMYGNTDSEVGSDEGKKKEVRIEV